MLLKTAVLVAVLLCFSGLATEVNSQENKYLIMAPKVMVAETTETVCIQLMNMTGPIYISVKLMNGDTEMKRIPLYFMEFPFACLEIEVPTVTQVEKFEATLLVSAFDHNDIQQLFTTSKKIHVEPRNSKTYIETDKPIYKPGQMVYFRILTLDQNLRPKLDMIEEVYVESPTGVRVAQWINVTTEDGLTEFDFQTTSEPLLGTWTITSIINSIKTTQAFEVEEYVLPKFEVKIESPSYILINETQFEIKVCGRYTYGQPVFGKVRADVTVKDEYVYRHSDARVLYGTRTEDTDNNGCVEFLIDAEIFQLQSWDYTLYNSKIQVIGYVTEKGTGIELSGTEYSGIVTRSPFKLEINGLKTFKPGLPFFGKIFVTEPDGTTVSNQEVVVTARANYGVIFDEMMTSDENGVIPFTLSNITIKATTLSIQAEIPGFTPTERNCDGWYCGYYLLDPQANLYTKASFSPSGSFIQLEPIQKTLNAGDKQELTIRYTWDEAKDGNPDDIHFQFLFMSRGNILTTTPIELLESPPTAISQPTSPDEDLEAAEKKAVEIIEEEIQDEELEVVVETVELEETLVDLNFTAISYPLYPRSPFPTVKISEPGKMLVTRKQFDVSQEMAPVTRILVYYIRLDGEVVADSIEVNIVNEFENKVDISFTENQKKPGEPTQLKIKSAADSLCAVGVVDKSVHLLRSSNQLTSQKVFSTLYDYQLSSYGGYIEKSKHCPEINYWYRKKRSPINRKQRSILPYPSHSTYEDSSKAFENMGLVFMTNIDVETRPCPQLSGPYPVALRTNVLLQEELPSYPTDSSTSPSIRSYFPETWLWKLKRQRKIYLKPTDVTSSWDYAFSVLDEINEDVIRIEDKVEVTESGVDIRSYFPETWLWKLQRVSESGEMLMDVTVPDTITEWVGNGFCTSTTKGVGVSSTTKLTAFQPFFVSYTLPYSVVRGEKVAIKTTIFNYLENCLAIKVKFEKTDDFDLFSKATQFVCVCGGQSTTIEFSIVPKAIGKIPLTMYADSVSSNSGDAVCTEDQVMSDLLSVGDAIRRELLVEAEGIKKEVAYTQLINVDESAGLSFKKSMLASLPDNFIEGSESGYMTLIGDMMGRSLENLDHLLQMPTGCGEQNMIGFVPNIYVLQYLNKTNQVDPAVEQKALNYMKIGYQRELNYRRSDSSYSAFGNSDAEGSTWLTAFVVKSFAQASKYIFVDEKDLDVSINWLKSLQMESGCFRSVGKVLHSSMQGGVDNAETLTAYIMIAMIESGISQDDAIIQNAIECVSANIDGLNDPYNVALIAYALTLADAPNQDTIIELLQSMAIEEGGSKHWEAKADDTSNYYYISEDHVAKARDVEATAYGLLALLSSTDVRNDQVTLSLPIVQWITHQTNPNGGYISTQDTVMALQAIATFAGVSYSNRADLYVDLQVQGVRVPKRFYVNSGNRLILQTMTFPLLNPFTAISITAGGIGSAVVQTVVRYNVPEAFVRPSFEVSADAEQIEGQKLARGCGQQIVDICTTYIGSASTTSMAVVEVRLPSGYYPDKTSLKSLVKFNPFGIKRYDIEGNVVSVYFDQFAKDVEVCFKFTIDQHDLVEDLKPGNVLVYDYYDTVQEGRDFFDIDCDEEIALPELPMVRANRLREDPEGPPVESPIGALPIDAFLNTCPPGKKFADGVKKCVDINECEDPNICPKKKVCVNTIGSYKCKKACQPGFKREGKRCVDINECEVNPNTCPEGFVCKNIKGDRLCEKASEVCKLDKVIGPCRASKRRFYWNKETKQCEKFLYGGCRGNENNFRTIDACEEKCRPEPPAHCLLPVESGLCFGLFNMFYYDTATKQCKSFVYGGCGGNNNRFETYKDCQSSCFARKKEEKEKPGVCPISGGGICVEHCSVDSDCEGDAKCCSNGCGHLCTRPLPAATCETGFEEVDGICVDINECSSIDACPQDMGCENTEGSYKCIGANPFIDLFLPLPTLIIDECPPVCEIYCVFGNVEDANGCPICECEPEPIIILEPECPPVCLIFCEFGNVEDANGCPICECKPDPSIVIGQTCPPVCEIYCEFGNVEDANGCPTCECKPDPSLVVTCEDGYEMVQGQCVDIDECRTVFNACPADSGCRNTEGSWECFGGNPFIGPLLPFLPDKEGDCPIITPDTVGTCVEMCKNDNDCEGTTKCCSNGCGHVCTEPVELTHCQKRQRQTEKENAARGGRPLLGAFNPACDDNGEYIKAQCRSTGFCFCVDEYGEIIQETMQDQRGVMPNCDEPVVEPTCPPICAMYCEFGNVEDANGCPICECKPDPSLVEPTCPPICAMYCEFGNVEDANGCPICECKPDPSLVACPPLCLMYCEFGNVEDANGCPICECKSDPSLVACPPLCLMYCEFGNVVDANGCPICECKPDPSIAVEPTCPPICAMYCEFGNVEDANGCPICECKPDPSLVACPPLCLMYCEFGNVVDANGCPICKCKPDPSIVIASCDIGYELVDGECVDINECERDFNACPQDSGCINNEGSYTCPGGNPFIDPTPELINIKDGSCPVIAAETAGICIHMCDDDDDCDANKKCCSNGCGNECMWPVDPCGEGFKMVNGECVELTHCQKRQKQTEKENAARGGRPLLGAFNPACDDNGEYIKAQCRSTGFCFCVDEYGEIIQETMQDQRGVMPNCDEPVVVPTCPPLCKMFCPFGNVEDANGCPICECKPDPSTVGECPVISPDTIGTCVEMCQSDNDCEGANKCCSNGCGHVCTAPVEPECPPLCKIFCPFGNVEDANGCPICECKPEPSIAIEPECPPLCKMFCPFGNVEDANGCPICECKPDPSLVACPPLCLMYCEFGNVVDANGCPVCECKPDPSIAIEPECPPLCKMFCPFGNVEDANGCPICECKPDPSIVIVPTCPPLCKMFCPFGNVEDANGCPICECKPDPSTVGECPVISPDTIGTCVEMCQSDNDCEGANKCCSNGCGHVCTAPVELTHCQKRQRQTEKENAARGGRPLLGAFNPACDDNGEYVKAQCRSTGFCFCVDEYGEIIQETMQDQRGVMPNCDEPVVGTCEDGYEMVQGQCIDIDECETVFNACPADSGCRNTEGSWECFGGNPFIGPLIPILTNKEGNCPVVLPDTKGTCVEMCKNDNDCEGTTKCCSNGCGHVCTAPVVQTCPPLCKMFCPFGNVEDANGCPICECKPEPSIAIELTHCQRKRKDYIDSGVIGGFLPKCNDDGSYIVSQCHGGTGFCFCVDQFGEIIEESRMSERGVKADCTQYELKIELEPTCPPLCRMFCPFGNVEDSNGCPICECKPDPSIAIIPPCPPVCAMYCEFGNVEDANGCPICECKPDPSIELTHCQRKRKDYIDSSVIGGFLPKCNDDGSYIVSQCHGGTGFCFCVDQFGEIIEESRMSERGVKANCTEYELNIELKPTCPPLCRMFCPFGNVEDSNGCPICECKPDPSIAIKPECPPVCLIFCEFGNVEDANGCPTCECKPDPSNIAIVCESGYYYHTEDRLCQDIDECQEANTCDATSLCVNMPGTYECECLEGYTKDNSNQCIDVNECLRAQPCGFVPYYDCVNTIGSFQCVCAAGYATDAFGNCQDIDECLQPMCGINFALECVNTVGSYSCECRKDGFITDQNGGCQDIDECADSNPCSENSVCRNTYGAYACDCIDNYIKNFEGRCVENIVKTGECPSTSGLGGICTNMCKIDSDCTGETKCCSNGCGLACMSPIVAAPLVAEPVEDCPVCATDSLPEDFTERVCKADFIWSAKLKKDGTKFRLLRNQSMERPEPVPEGMSELLMFTGSTSCLQQCDLVVSFGTYDKLVIVTQSSLIQNNRIELDSETMITELNGDNRKDLMNALKSCGKL